jgi:ATP-binding cassette subfamily F protein 3
MEADGRILHKPKDRSARMKLQFDVDERGGEMVVRCQGAAKGFDGVALIKDLDFEMTRGEKVGIIGPNGVGKTTLLRMLMRQVSPDAGAVRLFENLTVGYYDQEHRDLEPNMTVIESVREVRPVATEAEARSYLALFLFRGEMAFKRVGDLSGGEQSRILLARLVWTNPQVLVLDEPTNHLDIPGCEALEEALKLYPGSVLMVSHDRYFLDRVVDRLLVLPQRGAHEIVNGNWSTYAQLLAQREEAARAAQVAAVEERRATGSSRSSPAKKRKSRSKYLPKQIEELERSIMQAEHRIKELETTFVDPSVMKDAARSIQLREEYNSLRTRLADFNAQWEEAVDAMSGD